jgi:hypothetical protein
MVLCNAVKKGLGEPKYFGLAFIDVCGTMLVIKPKGYNEVDVVKERGLVPGYN